MSTNSTTRAKKKREDGLRGLGWPLSSVKPFDPAPGLATLANPRPAMNHDEIKAALLASYESQGGINHLDGVNLPSQ